MCVMKIRLMRMRIYYSVFKMHLEWSYDKGAENVIYIIS